MKKLLVFFMLCLVIPDYSFVQEDVTVSTILQRVNVNPGTYVSPAMPLSKLKTWKAKLDIADAAWKDPEIRITIVIEKSEDAGQTWVAWYTLNINGDTYCKDGSLPGIELYTSENEELPDVQIRVVFSINKQKRIGIIGESR